MSGSNSSSSTKKTTQAKPAADADTTKQGEGTPDASGDATAKQGDAAADRGTQSGDQGTQDAQGATLADQGASQAKSDDASDTTGDSTAVTGGVALDPTDLPNASSAKARPQQGAGGNPQAAAERIASDMAAASDTGPNHDLADPTPEHTARTPAQTVNTDPAAGPLEPPTDALLQRDPLPGYSMSSTDPVYGNTGGQTLAGERHDSLVDENGNALSAADLFTDDEPGKTFVTVGRRVFEKFYYPNTTTESLRLLYTPGQRVNRADAERMKASLAAVEQAKA